MSRILPAGALMLLTAGAFAADKPTQFWNLTSSTVTGFRLSHAGSGTYGDNLATADADGIDHDERLKLPGLPGGWYDVELRFKGGRVCFARHVEIVTGKVFSLDDKALIDCRKS